MAGCRLNTLLLFNRCVCLTFVIPGTAAHRRPPPCPSPTLGVCPEFMSIGWVNMSVGLIPVLWASICRGGRARWHVLHELMGTPWALCSCPVFFWGPGKTQLPRGSTLGGLAGLVGAGPRLNPLLSLLDLYLWMGSRVHLTLG